MPSADALLTFRSKADLSGLERRQTCMYRARKARSSRRYSQSRFPTVELRCAAKKTGVDGRKIRIKEG